MIGKALLAWLGVAATPRIHNDAVHDARNALARVAAVHDITVRQGNRSARTVKNTADDQAVGVANDRSRMGALIEHLKDRATDIKQLTDETIEKTRG